MSQYRTPTAYVLGVLVLLAVIVLTTPNGGTHARWSATAQAQVPAMTAGRVGFEVGGVESSATLTNTSGFGLEYRPLQVGLLDSAGRSVVLPDDMRFAYRTGADCGAAASPARWTVVAPGGPGPLTVGGETRAPLERDRPAGLCLTVSTDTVAEDALRPLDGQSLQVVTVLEAASLGDGAWSTVRSWTVPFTVDVPDATDPLQLQCTPVADSAKSVRLSWTGGPVQNDSWEVHAHRRGTSEPPVIVTETAGGVRSVDLTRDLLMGRPSQANGNYTLWVQPGPSRTPSTGERSSQTAIRLQGVNITCEGLRS